MHGTGRGTPSFPFFPNADSTIHFEVLNFNPLPIKKNVGCKVGRRMKVFRKNTVHISFQKHDFLDIENRTVLLTLGKRFVHGFQVGR